MDELDSSRRRFLAVLLAAPIAFIAVMRLRWPRPLAAAAFTSTPECGDDDDPTPEETEGPFFKPRSPLRRSLIEPGIEGTRIVVTGRVYSRRCRPLAGALLDFWHADDSGEYDNDGFKLRGHQFTDAKGGYRLETIVPGLYTGRTRHIHVKVQAAKGPVLTTQLYFPGEPMNRDDSLFRSDLLMSVRAKAPVQQARFHFVLDRS